MGPADFGGNDFCTGSFDRGGYAGFDGGRCFVMGSLLTGTGVCTVGLDTDVDVDVGIGGRRVIVTL